MKDFEKYAQENGFELRLGRWDFVYSEGKRTLTLPVEMLAEGDFIWELSRSRITAWDSPFDTEVIDDGVRAAILDRIAKYVELTGKKVRFV